MSSKRRSSKKLRAVSTATPTKRVLPVSAAGKSTADQALALGRGLPPARPGARRDGQSDYSVTSRIERIPRELTPAPLPPSPAAEAADVWFEQVPTNPAGVPDLAALAGSRPDIASALRDSQGRRDSSQSMLSGDAWAPPSYTPRPARRLLPLNRRPWVLPLLLTATALVVGMVLGALLFGGGRSSSNSSDQHGLAADRDCPTLPASAKQPGGSIQPDSDGKTGN